MNQNNDEQNENIEDVNKEVEHEEKIIEKADSELSTANAIDEDENYHNLKFKFCVSEIVWYSIFGVIFITGLILGILGICAVNLGAYSTNPIFLAMRDFSVFLKRSTILDWRILGAGLMIVAMIGFIISTIFYMNKFITEKASKKKYNERLQILMSSDLASLDEQEDFEKEKEKQAQKE